MLVGEHLRLQFLQRRHATLFVVTYFSPPLYSLAVTAHAATWALSLGSFTLPECGPVRDKHHRGALHLSNTFLDGCLVLLSDEDIIVSASAPDTI